MGFPYLQPIKNWVAEELEKREAAPELESMKMPFIVLTSAATVAKSNTYEAAINGDVKDAYYGCVIANNPEAEKNYGISTNNGGVILGYDFNGKRIVTEGENGIRKPMPVINSLSINTDGDNNALKTAQINITLFTLKQLELFEIFFCRPGYNIMVEFGNNFILNSKRESEYKKFLGLENTQSGTTSIGQPLQNINNKTGKKIENTQNGTDLLIPKNKYSDFVQNEFKKYFSVSDDELLKYYEKIAASRGNYDVFAGKVENFTLEIGENGTYNVMLTINAGNTVSLAISQTITNELTKIALKDKNANVTREEIVRRQMRLDLNLPKLELSDDDIKKHTFNFININDKSTDNQTSDIRYITLHFIIKYLLNYVVDNTATPDKSFKFELQKFKDAGKEIEGIPCNSKENIISSSDSLIYPGYLPNVLIGTEKDKKDNLRLVIDSKNPARDCRINEIEFNIKDEIEIPIINQDNKKEWKKIKPTEKNKIGNAANIFVKYEEVVEMWKKSTTRAEFVNAVLGLINENSYGLFTLTISPKHGDGGGMTIIDRKFNSISETDKDNLKNPTKIYRFKPNSIKSIVKNFSLQLDMGNLVAGQTVFQTTITVENYLNKNNDDPEKAIKQYDEDNAKALKYKNADGYYSVDGVDTFLTKQKIQEKAEKNKSDKLSQQSKQAEKKAADQEEKKSAQQPKDDSEIIDSKVIKFKLPTQPLGDKGKVQILILNDKDNVHGQLGITRSPDNTTTLSSLTANITINGMSGFSAGEYFRINGIPEVYNKNGVFQITNVRHNVEGQNWDTEVEAMWLIFNNKES